MKGAHLAGRSHQRENLSQRKDLFDSRCDPELSQIGLGSKSNDVVTPCGGQAHLSLVKNPG